jgi:methionine--tRNA ligase beta chain
MTIGLEEFAKVDIRIGEILSAEKIVDADKLLLLKVDFGEEGVRQIVSGIAHYFPDPAQLVGVQTTFVFNLEPRTIRGYESNGMLFAHGEGDTFTLLVPQKKVPSGKPLH